MFRDQNAVTEVDRAGVLLEMLLQRPWDPEVVVLLFADLPYCAQWWVEALSQTALARLQPDSLEQARMILILSNSKIRIRAGNRDLRMGRPGFRPDARTLKMFEEITTRYPGTSVSADCHFQLGCWERDRQDFESAAMSFGKAAAEFQMNDRARDLVNSLHNQAVSWQAAGKTGEASRADADAWKVAEANKISIAEVIQSSWTPGFMMDGHASEHPVFLESVEAQLAYQMKWVERKEPADANLPTDLVFIDFVKETADGLKGAGKFAEAAALYEKLSHAYERSPLPDNWKGIDLDRVGYVATLRYGSILHRAECLEAMQDIDGAVQLYKRVARECDGRDLQRPDSMGPLDKVAVKRLEILRARQEQAAPSGEGQGAKAGKTP